MNEFEKFNSKRGIDHRMRFSGAAQFRAYIEQEREDTWIKALEWALDVMLDGHIKWAENDIRKELDG